MGYWNDDDKTAAAFTEDGYYRTGDVCELVDGRYTVIGRLKFHFKLSSGEFLVPEYLESIYSKSPLISQIFIHGLSSFNSPVAVIVPNINAVHCFFEENELEQNDVPLSENKV